MTDEHDEKDAHYEPMDEGPGSDRLRDLLKRTAEAPVPPPKADVLQGVQRRLRQRSRGKFYGDGWSTREESPRGTYLITAAMMLFVVLVLYYMLAPAIY